MCVYIAIIATILQVMMWCMVSAPALKCNSYGLQSRLTWYLEKDSVHRKKAWYLDVWGSVYW